MTPTLFVLALLASVPGSGPQLESEGAGRTLTVVLAPGTAPGSLKLVLSPSWGEARTVELPAGSEGEAQVEVGKALDAGPAQGLVLSVDTRLRRAQAVPALSAARERGLQPELRFAGPTNLPGGNMPEVLELLREVGVTPPLSKAEVEAVQKRALPQVRECYWSRLEVNALEGRLVVQLRLGADGGVTQATALQSLVGDGEVERCVLEALRGLRFPRLRGAPALLVTWPFVFQKGAPQLR